jgi:hypothetical protein
MKSAQQRKCLFCDQRADTREHVVAEWLTKRMKVRDRAFQAARFVEGQGLKTFPATKVQHFRTRQVCTKCNGGWMRLLEQWFQTRLGYLVEPQWPRLAYEMLTVLRDEADSLIRWMIKSAVIFERATPRGLIQTVPDDVRAVAKDRALSQDFHVWVGHIVEAGWDERLAKGLPVWNGGYLYRYQQHEEGFSFAVHLNHLAIRLVRCPDASPVIKASVVLSDGRPVVPFWVKPATKYDISVAHTFPDFSSFIDAVEIQAEGRANMPPAPTDGRVAASGTSGSEEPPPSLS